MGYQINIREERQGQLSPKKLDQLLAWLAAILLRFGKSRKKKGPTG